MVVHVQRVKLRAMKNLEELPLERLDLGQLALFVGQRVNERVLEALHARGFAGLRTSHGYVVQHVVSGPRSISELARRMGVTQQAASKIVAELVELGYLELAAGDDARQKLVRLSSRGRRALATSRRLRAALERKLLRDHSERTVAQTRAVLTALLEQLGAADAIRTRSVREPR